MVFSFYGLHIALFRFFCPLTQKFIFYCRFGFTELKDAVEVKYLKEERKRYSALCIG